MPSAPTMTAYLSGTTHAQLKLYLDQSFKPEALITPIVPCIYHTSGCKKTFDIREELEQHVLRNLTTDKDHEWCDECDLAFPNIKAIRHHHVVSEIHEFVCPVCAMEFKSEGGLKRHTKQEYTRKKEVTCLGCDEVFYGSDGGAIAALMKHHVQPGNCNGKETTNVVNQDIGILDLAGGVGQVEWPTLATPKKETQARPNISKAHQGTRISTVRIVDKVFKPVQKLHTEQVGLHKSSATVDHPATVVAVGTSNIPHAPTQVQQNISEVDKVLHREEDTVKMETTNVPGVLPKIQATGPTTVTANNSTRPVSYASAIKTLLQEVRDEKKSVTALPGQSNALKPAQPVVSPWGMPKGKLNASSAVVPRPPIAVPIATTHTQQPLAPSPALITSTTHAPAATSSRPRKRVKERYKWGPKPPKTHEPVPHYKGPAYIPPFEGYNPQVEKWLENVSNTPENAEALSSSELDLIEEDETLPSSRPRTPDNCDYDIVLQEHMGGNRIEDDGNWISVEGLQKLERDNMKRKMLWESQNKGHHYLDEDALQRLADRVFAEKLGNPAWLDEPVENAWRDSWGETKQEDQVSASGNKAAADDAELTWGESRQVSSSLEAPSWQNAAWNKVAGEPLKASGYW